MSEVKLEDIVSLCKRRGFIYQGSEVYGGLAGTWDYGPLGVQLKKNIMDLWWQMFVDTRDDVLGVDAAILMNQQVWQASGHTETFTDPLVECSNCNARFRADKLDDPNKCPNCGETNTFGEPRQFNMMFETKYGPLAHERQLVFTKQFLQEALDNLDDDDEFKHRLVDEVHRSKSLIGDNTIYLRPETAQGIFTNFRNVVDSFYPDVPFGLAQQGKAFRNEISPRDFIFRCRELEQMEIEYFVHPDNWEEAFEMWVKLVHDWCDALGLPKEKVHELEVPESDRAHYSKRTIDFEYDFPIGREELSGLAYRTDFDLKNIEKGSGKSMEYRPKDGSAPFVPHVIEPSFGVERAVMAVLSAAYWEDTANERIVLKLPMHLAPIKVAVLPLAKNKPELVKKAREVYDLLKKEFGSGVAWVDTGNIGKNYKKMDEIGVMYCVTVDYETLEGDTKDTVTVRHRDTTAQDRVKIDELLTNLQ
ncbi:MAG TPA: glycine--tRNA ligase [Candidatus Saccharimonadales bacterium]|nr:glycine--tRNA ligase [Candidatus Saccharimonadales bacterium]